ncbi:membrane associated protein [Staphylococcus aureus]|nr:membrane associated protein [Staphylococcus aureus]
MKNLKNSLFISLIIGLSLSLFFSMLFADGKYYPLNPQSTIGILYYTHFTETTVMLISIILWLLIGVVFFLGDFIFNTQIGALLKQL